MNDDERAFLAYSKAKAIGQRVSLEEEEAVLKIAFYCRAYAAEVIHGKWYEAEAILLTDPVQASLYARYALRGPWPEAEDVIATNSNASWLYLEAIKNRFRKGESAIRENRFYWKKYLEMLAAVKPSEETLWEWVYEGIDENLVDILNHVTIWADMQEYILEHRPDLAGRLQKLARGLKAKCRHELELAGVDV